VELPGKSNVFGKLKLGKYQFPVASFWGKKTNFSPLLGGK
jgi:hypothetical protein